MTQPDKKRTFSRRADDAEPLLGWRSKPSGTPSGAPKWILLGLFLSCLVVIIMLLSGVLVTLTALLAAPEAIAAVSTLGCWRATLCRGPSALSWPGVWEQYNYSPATRVVGPVGIHLTSFEKISDFPGLTTLKNNGSIVIYDFGKDVGGVITVTYNARGTGNLGLAFSEARNWTGEWSDGSNGSFQPDGAVYGNILEGVGRKFVMPDHKTRGGFRYLTVFTSSGSRDLDIEITDISLELSFQPDWPNLRAYRGYFHSSDPLLNKIWYSGAYTLQTNAIPTNQGRAWPILGGGWLNNMNLNVGSDDPVIFVDGSKRDRTVWAGDLAVAVPSILVSLGDWHGVKNTLQVMYNDQLQHGELPFAGPAINIYNSDTYHCATLMGTYDYFLFTNDRNWLWGVWRKYKLAMSYIIGKIDNTGMLYVTGRDDWGRLNQGGHNSEANMMMYRTLTTGSALATWMGDPTLSAYWAAVAARLKIAVNQHNFDSVVGAFKDTDLDGSIHPEDANSMALLFSGALNTSISSISKQLTTNWNAIGAVAPELPNNIVGYIQSFEVKGHLAVGQTARGLELIRRAWGWYLNNPHGTASTCIEGYLADGTFGYRSANGYGGDYSYTSHAHGWSTGPTDGLTSYIVGLTIIQPGGSEWQFAPQFGDLKFAEAGFTTPLGKFYAKWTLTGDGFAVEWAVPTGSKGRVVLPAGDGKEPTVIIDNGKGVAGEVDVGTLDKGNGKLVLSSGGGTHSAKIVF